MFVFIRLYSSCENLLNGVLFTPNFEFTWVELCDLTGFVVFKWLLTKMILKEKIEKQFSKNSCNYEDNAKVQKYFTDQFFHFFKTNILYCPLKILEIGCGTGFLTEKLVKAYEESEFLVTDISPSMVDFCKSKFQNKKISYLACDGESICLNTKFDLICSSLTFQWFVHLNGAILHLLNLLNEDGVLAFSFFDRDSFPEWREICHKLNYPFTGNRLPCSCEVDDFLRSKAMDYQLDRSSLTVCYPGSLSFFQSLKKIGAAARLDETLRTSPVAFKNFLLSWDTYCKKNIPITYNVTSIIITRKKC